MAVKLLRVRSLQRRGVSTSSRAVRVNRTRRVAGVMMAATLASALVSTAVETARTTRRLLAMSPRRVLPINGTSRPVRVSIICGFLTTRQRQPILRPLSQTTPVSWYQKKSLTHSLHIF